MPTYQYHCKSCGHDLEAIQAFSDAPLTECPECSGQLRKVFSAVGVVFKGSGFYATDNRSKPKTQAAKPAEKSESATTSSTESTAKKPEKTESNTQSAAA